MKELLKPTTDERPAMIILGIAGFYLLILVFIIYLYLLHRIGICALIISSAILTLFYFPRFLIIKKLQNKDKIEIRDNYIVINANAINFADICDFRIEDKKPRVVFFINNRMVVFKEANFHLKLTNGQVSFSAIGSEKIRLLNEFLTEITRR